MFGERRPALAGDSVVLALATVVCGTPGALDVAEVLEPVKQRVQETVGPLDLAVAQVADALQNGIPIALPLGEDSENQGCGRRRHEVFRDMHRTTLHRSAMYVQGFHEGYRGSGGSWRTLPPRGAWRPTQTLG